MPNDEMSEKVPAFAGAHEPRPLPLEPAKLAGISERLIRSHGENNSCGDREAMEHVLSHAFGSVARWEAEFRRTANALAGGSEAKSR